MGLLPSDQALLAQYGMLGSAGQGQLRNYYGQIQQDIGQQFAPAFRMAQARLAGAPLLADSGYANRLNRQLQQGAYGDLMSRYGNAANDLAGGNLSALRNMIAQRQAERGGVLQNYLDQRLRYATRPKRSPWGAIGSLVGTAAGALIGGPPGATAGASIGSGLGSMNNYQGPWP